MTSLDRFYKHVSMEPMTGCWLWTGYTDRDGYGSTTCDSMPIRANRLSYILHLGNIPKGSVVRHSCDTPACVNPKHLILGTHKDNRRDCVARGRENQKGQNNNGSKLVDFVIPKIRSDNRSCFVIAAEYGVSFSLIARIKRGKAWTHILSPEVKP